jgi:4-amino-4-deoxy-L-arabinose transferase-like glycosyltransferase
MNSEKEKRYGIYLGAFAMLHLLLWTILPAIMRPNLPLDTLEAFAWGMELQLGYYKHPPLSAWITYGASAIFDYQPWLLYLLSQICVAISFFTIWRTAKLFLENEENAFMATLLVSAIYYYNFTAIEFNPNVLLLPIWALMIFYSFKSCQENKLRHWLLFAIFAGAGILAKYFTILLLTSIALLILYQPKFRRRLKSINPYISAALLLLIITPNIYWLIKNNFSTLHYAMERSIAQIPHNNLSALSFSISQFFSLVFALGIFLISFGKITERRKFDLPSDEKLSFLLFVGFGPFILLITYAAIAQSLLKDMWGTEFWGLFTIFLFYIFQPKQNNLANKLFFRLLVGINLLLLIAFISQSHWNFSKRSNFNGKQVAEIATNQWHAHVDKNGDKNISYVVGDTWLSSNIAFYSKERPRIFLDMMVNRSSWIDFEDFKNKGGIIVWDAKKEGEDLPERFIYECNKLAIIKGYPNCNSTFNILEQPAITIAWSGVKNKEPYLLGLAFFFPKN